MKIIDRYHPEYGFPQEARIEAVLLAKEIGTTKAAEKLGYSPTSVRRWVRELVDTSEQTNAA